MRLWAPVLSAATALASAEPIYAQCTSDASFCVTCHETQGLRPLLHSPQVLLVFAPLVVLVLALTARVERNAP